MLWEFGELGYDYSITFGGDRLAPKPPRWDYQDEWRRRYLFSVTSSLINLKKEQEVFETTDFAISLNGALKKINLTGTGMNAAVIGNFDVKEGSIVPGFQQTGMWYDYFSGDSLAVDNLNASVSLGPGEYRIYTSVKLPKPLFTAVPDPEDPSMTPADLVIYPNPTSGILHIKSTEPIIRTELYNASGVRVMTGSRTSDPDLTLFPPGIYCLRIFFDQSQPVAVKVVRK